MSRGQLVPYEITVNNELGVALPDLSIVDRFPAGFRYVEGSARVDGVPIEPTINGQELTWTDLGVAARVAAACSCCSRSVRASARAST